MDFQYKKAIGLTTDQTLSLEWLETNGLGGYASSTITNCNTRKYHGLLVSNLQNPFGKYVFLSQLEDVFKHIETEHFLTAHQYCDAFLDGSFDYYQEFKLATHPVFFYRFGNIVLSKEILLLHGQDTILIKYKLQHTKNDDISKSKIILRPLLACRNFHDLTHENNSINKTLNICQGGFAITPYEGLPTLYLQTNARHDFQENFQWYKNFHYIEEQKRGFESREDLFAPGIFTLNFNPKKEIIFACSLKEENISDLSKHWEKELKYKTKLNKQKTVSSFFKKHPVEAQLQKQLQKVGKSFFQTIPQTNKTSIIAGYHWFLCWGRDTMVSLPGLTLLNGKKDAEKCLSILRHYSQHEHNGLIPNFLGETKEKNAYNTVDASLWFAYAIQQYYLKTKNHKAIATSLWSTLKNIFTSYKHGTEFGIHLTEDGLVAAGDAENNLTWMDSMVYGKPCVPRNGLAVEVNALWYNMLCFMQQLAKKLQDPINAEIEPLINKFNISFVQTFWDAELGYLRDCVNPQDRNSTFGNSLRPNQIFAISLPYSPLPQDIMVKVVDKVRKHLLTPLGLRTLAPEDPNYIGSYMGSPEKRDYAYHNGTVWPWLLGHFANALIKVTPNKSDVKRILEPCLVALEKHLFHAGIGTISEIFSGDEPQEPNGCISQAWSVAELLRITHML